MNKGKDVWGERGGVVSPSLCYSGGPQYSVWCWTAQLSIWQLVGHMWTCKGLRCWPLLLLSLLPNHCCPYHSGCSNSQGLSAPFSCPVFCHLTWGGEVWHHTDHGARGASIPKCLCGAVPRWKPWRATGEVWCSAAACHVGAALHVHLATEGEASARPCMAQQGGDAPTCSPVCSVQPLKNRRNPDPMNPDLTMPSHVQCLCFIPIWN